MSPRPIVVKLGGSAITRKNKPFVANLSAIKRITKEISQAGVSKLIVIHGGGSFGHPVAKQYSIKGGFKGKKNQLLGFSKTHQAMLTLNKLVIDALIRHNISAVAVSPSSCTVTKSGRIETMFTEPLEMLLQTGIVPVLYGDCVLDHELGFTILSGDQLTAALAVQLDAERIVIGIDEDGLYTADPKESRSAGLICHCTLSKLREMQIETNRDTNSFDVTGGMMGKIAELSPAIEKGIPTFIVNATKRQRIYRALKAERVIGTLIQNP